MFKESKGRYIAASCAVVLLSACGGSTTDKLNDSALHSSVSTAIEDGKKRMSSSPVRNSHTNRTEVEPEPVLVTQPEPSPPPSPPPSPTIVAPAPETGTSWTHCANENGVCTLSDTREVRYGLDQTWVTRIATGSIACSNEIFGDPLPGADKVCEYASTTAATTSPPGPVGQDASQYRLSFTEEFNDGFNWSVWNDTIWYEQSNPTINYAVEGGKLKIWPQRDANGNFFNRTIDTDAKYYQTYGYFEIEAKLPKGKGTWPAFWLFNHIGSRRPEIDVMEAYPGGADPWGFTDSDGVRRPQAFAATVWKGDVEGQMMGSRTLDTRMDLSETFNTYAVKWEPHKQTFYFNGKEILIVNVSMGDPMYIMLDLWFGSASGTPDHMTPQGKPNSYEINYVRAWQFR